MAKPKVKSVKKMPISMSGNTDPGSYDSFVKGKNLSKSFGGRKISAAALRSYVQDHYPDVRVPSRASVDDIFQLLYEEDVGRGDNTYNWSWWGPTLHIRTLGDATEEPYAEGVVLARPHLGGDVRGNYADAQAFLLENYAEEVPWYDVMLSIHINTDRGHIFLDSEDTEGYTFRVETDETGTWGADDDVRSDAIESELDWGDKSLW
jgi:hypothetical protein